MPLFLSDLPPVSLCYNLLSTPTYQRIPNLPDMRIILGDLYKHRFSCSQGPKESDLWSGTKGICLFTEFHTRVRPALSQSNYTQMLSLSKCLSVSCSLKVTDWITVVFQIKTELLKWITKHFMNTLSVSNLFKTSY